MAQVASETRGQARFADQWHKPMTSVAEADEWRGRTRKSARRRRKSEIVAWLLHMVRFMLDYA